MSSGSVDSEASKPPMASNSEDADSVESRFTNLCEVLTVGEDVKKEAKNLLKDIKSIVLTSSFGTRPQEELEKYCFAFVLYCVMKLSKEQVKEERKEGNIGLFQILRCAKLKVDDFFKEALQFSFKVDPILGGLYGVDWEERLQLKPSENMVNLLTDASKFYDKAFRELFSRTIDHQATISNCGRSISEFHRFGWLLFLALRNHSPDLFQDLVSCVHGLVAILVILIIHIPTVFRNFTIQDSSHLVKRSEKGIDILASLCHTHHTSEDLLKRINGKVHNLIVDILNKKPLPASECNAENLDQINTDGLTYFKDLLDENSLQSSVCILEKHYDDLLSNQGDLDERVFVKDGDNLLGTESSTGGATSLCSTRWKFETLASPTRTITSMLTLPRSPSSPANGNSVNKIVQMTPVSTAMTTAKWLRDVISSLPQKPSSELEHFLSSCDKNMTGDVTRRANIILEAIFPSSSAGEQSISGTLHYANSFDTTWAQERKMEALKLYYRVLEAICKAESQLLNGNNLTSLLSNERFHRCMIACSAELVLATHKTVIMMFPAVLETTGLTAFDLSKVIESFVRHEETLPRELKRHLNSLEEQLLEIMAWGKGSSLYNSLIVARPVLAQEINRLRLLAEPMLSLDEIAVRSNIPVGRLPSMLSRKRDASPDQNGDARSPKRTCNEFRSVLVECNTFTSPVKERSTFSSQKSMALPLQSTFASPTQPNPAGGETCAEIGIKIFFSKILKLAAIRIRSLCERLRQSQQILERVYSIFQQILNQQTALFFNRHVDQLILCCLYGVSKVSQLNLTFKEIVNNYRKEPQCKSEVFRSVFVGHLSANGSGGTGVDHVDIITFYNEIFIPTVKPLLIGLIPAGVHAEDRNSTDSQIPGSPKLSPFSNLPDMSPKKVSAAHNVYVSPLRQSKMDALLSPSSRSYYACIGESTRAYQSPSKDLAAINNRLNCTGRRINGRINFDIVSDSVVAGSLGYQNGSTASSDGIATSNLPIKHEQPQP